MIDKKYLENLLHEKHSLTRTEDSQAAINEIMENLDGAIKRGLRSVENKNENYLEELLKEPGAELRVGGMSLVWNFHSNCWTILNILDNGDYEIYKENIELQNVCKIMMED